MPYINRLTQTLCFLLLCFPTVFATVSVSPLFTDHMVLQRDAPLHIWGNATTEKKITLQFAGTTVQTKPVNQQWEIVLPALPAGGPYTLTITGQNTIIVSNILLGDVWICAGQSNMRFRVNQAQDADMAILQGNNPMLRLADWEGTLTPANQRYPLSFLRELNSSNFYTSKEWKQTDSASISNFSAVGYFFGNNLQKLLNIPIGLMNNSIGGVPVETYIPVSEMAGNSLLAPLAGKDWLHSPLYPVWTAERVMQNLVTWKEAGSAEPMPAHPYQPGFLFEAGIAPLQKLAVKGVIWYQGESNATYTADSSMMSSSLNKEKLTLLISSWRKHFANPELPFLLIQLPAVRRDWEQYREIQSSLAREIPGVSAIVTLDLGHATDVHPRNKKTVGERSARMALAEVYHKNIIAGGPEIESYRTEGKYLVIRFRNAPNGLITRDGEPLRRILVCGTDKHFFTAQAQFKKNELWLSAPEVSTPVAARYAWEDDPYDANLGNFEGLPAAPFRTDKWQNFP